MADPAPPSFPPPLKPSTALGDLDGVLRGSFTGRDALRSGRIDVTVRRLVPLTLLLGMFYGACMGLFPLLRNGDGAGLQMVATIFKVPLLFVLTLAVTFPSLYVFSALTGSRLPARATLRLLIIAITVNMAVLAGFGPVTAFFVLCTDSYAFIKLLNVAMFGTAGIISLGFLKKALGHVFAGDELSHLRQGDPAVSPSPGDHGDAQPPPTSTYAARARPAEPSRQIFTVWLVIYGIVGAQMGWVMRPFIGNPDAPFEWFRARESNFLTDVFKTLGELFS